MGKVKNIDEKIINKANSSIKNISEILINYKFQSDNIGLYDGMLGVSIFLLQYSKWIKNTSLLEYGFKILEKVVENAANSKISLDHQNGLCGIGSAIEYLNKNKLIQVDTDEILLDTDVKIYESIKYKHNKVTSLASGVIGKCVYFLSRLKPIQINFEIKDLRQRECLILLTDDIRNNICHTNSLNIVSGCISDLELSECIMVLSKMQVERICLVPTISLYDIISRKFRSELYIHGDNFSLFSTDKLIEYTIILNRLIYSAKLVNDDKLFNVAKYSLIKLLQILNDRMYNIEKKELYKLMFNAFFFQALIGLYTSGILKKSNDLESIINLFTSNLILIFDCNCHNEENYDNLIHLSLTSGLSGIGLSLLSLLFPKKSDWGSLLLLN